MIIMQFVLLTLMLTLISLHLLIMKNPLKNKLTLKKKYKLKKVEYLEEKESESMKSKTKEEIEKYLIFPKKKNTIPENTEFTEE